jgi:hypothetical protein
MKESDQFIPLAALCIMVLPTSIGIWLVFDIRYLPALAIAALCIMPIQLLEPTIKKLYKKSEEYNLFTTLHWWFCILLSILSMILSPIFMVIRALD